MRRAEAAAAAGRWALVALLAGAIPARAAIEGSPHDLGAQGYDVARASASRERCSRCHLPSGGGGRGFVPEVPPVFAGLWNVASLACFSCHDGTTIVSPEVDASVRAFHPLSHGADVDAYRELPKEEGQLPLAAGERVQCATCHDPHDNGHRPFLRRDIAELCTVCHAARFEVGRGKENLTGNHPVQADPFAPDRTATPVAVSPPFLTPFPAPYPLLQGKAAAGVHWELGGHLTLGAQGQLACVTCHTVHGDAAGPPRGSLLTVDPVNDVADLFCEGCHAGERGDARQSAAKPNPGGTVTGRTYHPADDDVANGEGRVLEVTIPEGWPVGGGAPARLLCSTCHAPHAAAAATQLLRPTEPAPGFCEACHAGMTLDYHHPVGGDGPCSRVLPPADAGEPEGMACARCHRAHNAGLGSGREAAYIPLLREEPDTAFCASCHPPQDPTCGGRKEYQASHFLGDPVTEYQDNDPPFREEPWPESGLYSRYGSGERREVTCLSCHSFAKTAVVSGDDKEHGYLLARSGNPVDWARDEGIYLCTGCHSGAPGTGQQGGHSHPMMGADLLQLRHPILPPASVTDGQRVNCDSCHRPHEAPTTGGYYILEKVGGANTDPVAIHPRIDFTSLCYLCHDEGEY